MSAEPASMTRPRLIALKQAARETGIPYTSLRDLALRGELAIVRVGRALYVERLEVTRWIDNHREPAGVPLPVRRRA
jgi:hypothetical protein